MIYKTQSPLPDHVQVIFELPACTWADRIFLVGEFNEWNVTATPMQQDRDGVWRATLHLPCGRHYEFRYLVDGQWMTDYHADNFVTNAYGTKNSIVNATLPAELLTIERMSSQVWDNSLKA